MPELERCITAQNNHSLAGKLSAISMGQSNINGGNLPLAGQAHQLLRGFHHGEQAVHSGMHT